jgi:AcrR family transcriptional regulator
MSAAAGLKAAVRERREEERRLRRRAILAAAKRVYSHKGFLAATIEDIAAAARVSVGTIYLYYRSKEELYVSLLEETMEAFARELTRILHSRLRPDRKLRAAWEFFYRFRRASPESYRVFFLLHQESFRRAVPRTTLARLNLAAARNFAIAASIVREAMDSGWYLRGDCHEVVDVMWSLFMGVVHLSEIRASLGSSVSTLEQLHRAAFRWLEDGLRVQPTPDGSLHTPPSVRRPRGN